MIGIGGILRDLPVFHCERWRRASLFLLWSGAIVVVLSMPARTESTPAVQPDVRTAPQSSPAAESSGTTAEEKNGSAALAAAQQQRPMSHEEQRRALMLLLMRSVGSLRPFGNFGH